MSNIQQKFDQVFIEANGREDFNAEVLDQLSTLIGAGALPAVLSLPIFYGASARSSALIIAAAKGLDHVVELFLRDKDLDANAVDDEGETALFSALMKGSKKCASLLIPRSNLSLTCDWGGSSLSLAIDNGMEEAAFSIIERLTDEQCEHELSGYEEGAGKKAWQPSHLSHFVQQRLLSRVEKKILCNDEAVGRGINARARRAL